MLIQRSPAAVSPVRLSFGEPVLTFDLGPKALVEILAGRDVLGVTGEFQGRPVRLNLGAASAPEGLRITLYDVTAQARLGVAAVDPAGLTASDQTVPLKGSFAQSPEWKYAGTTKEYARGKNNALITVSKGDPTTPMGRHNMIASKGLNPQDGWVPEERAKGFNFARWVLNGKPVL